MGRRAGLTMALASAFLLTLAAGCSDDSESGGASGFCVGDKRDPKGCPVSWELMDACPALADTPAIELAVFDGGCPTDQSLRDGDTASALVRASFDPTVSFPPLKGLGKQQYGFAFLSRDASCVVTGFGCTEADLTAISGIKTVVCDWSSPDGTCACTALAGGGCPLPETCAAGACSGVPAG